MDSDNVESLADIPSIKEIMDEVRVQTIDVKAVRPTVPSDESIEWAARELEAGGYDRRVPENFTVAAKYLAALRDGVRTKGLCLLGRVGVGKTGAVKVIAEVAGFRWRDSIELCDIYQSSRENFVELLTGGDYRADKMVIDELGSEPTVCDYGTRLEVLADVIARRSTIYQNSRVKTIITCNLPITTTDGVLGIVERYGERTMSRIQGMCNVIVFEGPDQRQTANDEYLG